jgi:hypothetical protein
MVDQRLARLSPATIEVLELAAVMGADFELDTVRRAASGGEEVLVDALEEAVRSGLLVEEPGAASRTVRARARPARRRRPASAARKAELHLRVAEALEHGHSGGDSRAVLVRRSRTTSPPAAPVGGHRGAPVAYNLLAAESAIAALAY